MNISISCQTLINMCIPDPCNNNGQCIQTSPNKYQCSCYYGYNGVNCTNILDLCSPNPCQQGSCLQCKY